jgi:predicted secreted protein
MKIDIEDTEAKIAEFLTNVGKDHALNEFKIIYCGIAESWGKEI